MSKQALERKVDKIQDGRRLFTETQFKQASRLEKIEMHLIQPSLSLNDQDTTYLHRLETAFMISRKSVSMLQVIKKMMKLYPKLNYQNAAKLIQDADELFAPVIKRSKEMSLAILSFRSDEVYKAAIRDKNFKQANESIKLGVLIENNRKEEESQDFWSRLQPPDINFTTDPKALQESEEIDFEELSEEYEKD